MPKNTGTYPQDVQRALSVEYQRLYNLDPVKCSRCDVALPYKKRWNKYCGRSCSATVGNTGRIKSQNQRDKTRATLLKAYETGRLIGPVKKRIERICEKCGTKELVSPCYASRRYCSKKCANAELSKNLKGKVGGYREGSGRGKSGWYKGYYCSSTWELIWIIYQLDHGIEFVRNYEGFPYTHKGNSHLYYPDFIVDGEYIEVKGYDTDKDKSKWTAFPKSLKVLRKADMQPIMEYVVGNYDVKKSTFVKLYDSTSSPSPEVEILR